MSNHLEEFLKSIDVEDVYAVEMALDELKDALIILQDYFISALETMAEMDDE